MKKNLIYLLILVALAVIAFFAFREEKPLFPIEEANFKVENTKDVTEIFLSDPGVDNIKLSKNSEGLWLVNDSFRARQDWVAFLLEGMEKQNASQMVPKSMHNGAIKQLAGSSVKVEVYKGDEKTNSYFVAKEPGKDNLTIMLNIRPDGTNAPRPFLVKCGFTNTFLGVRYLTDLENWRDKQIMYFPNSKLQAIKVAYTEKPSANFEISVNPEKQIIPSTDTANNKLNEIRLEKYISFFSNLYCMGFENDYILKDTFLKAFTPIAEVEVRSIDNKERSLSIYYRQVNKGTHNILTVDGKQYDGDSFFGWLNKRDLVLLSSTTVQKMLREHHEFFNKDVESKSKE